ncbi:bifunctional diguanylate cyclase/phosphodiesterase [Roseateles violae]|uniref:EAL domain-containing protein n=1 Tax=Roseateles violae TaxID=3058042 RepID=A0ABT8DMZ3_9BURK|nr:EAL domain-containing protein [Pelomonas sp. PFR6]MDN3919750.1 EAL domain-containing protein [Pelomonas sp. PFR6]
MSFLPSTYNPAIVALSLFIAVFASYVALDLAKRVRLPDRRAARHWWLGGSVAMGTGIWAMHFIGMFAFSLPIALGYRGLQTLLSWLAAVIVSAIALHVANSGRLRPGRLVGGAILMGAGICAMHYTGMAALDMAPPIVWDLGLVAASAAIAIAASLAALLIFFWLRRVSGARGQIYQLLAALVMGLAIAGMHYTGMAAAHFPVGAVCRSADQLAGQDLGVVVTLATVALLGLTLFTSTLDTRMQSRTARLADSLRISNRQLQTANEELQRRAFVDPLTGLPNRLLFEDRLQHALVRIERSLAQPAEPAEPDRSGVPERLAVLFVDLDGFKPINDSFGHAMGDAVLQEVGRRLLQAARDADTVARVGGDEFVLLLEGLADAEDGMGAARRIVEQFATPLEVDGQNLHLGASVGVVLFPDHGPGDKLMARADAAMYAAKRRGGHGCALFEPNMDLDARVSLSLQSDLRQAIARGQLRLHYQPKVDARRLQLSGVEALLRWEHPQHGSVPPAVFIPLAERHGLIDELGDWVIDQACRQMALWRIQGLRLRVAINLSVHQLRQSDLVERVGAALRRHRVDADQLLCEITESMAMDDVRAAQQSFEGLARIGVSLSIDDFGAGYSSLSHLRRLPARQLKIDASFVQDLASSADARAIVDGIIRLAHALDLEVVAEGVETEAQRDVLIGLDCDKLQGYLFARPMPAAALLDWALARRAGGAEGGGRAATVASD